VATVAEVAEGFAVSCGFWQKFWMFSKFYLQHDAVKKVSKTGQNKIKIKAQWRYSP
jgi:hypothetical protein